MQEKGPYKVLSSEVKYKNPWIEVREDKVMRPDGKEGIFGTVDYGSGVRVVAIDEKQNIVLIREYCYVLEDYLLQAPGGGVDDGEKPLQAAQKELLEETGMVAAEWIDLGRTDPLTMIIKCPEHMFLALNVSQRQAPESETEQVTMPFKNACQLVVDGKIPHTPSSLAILLAKIRLEK